MNRPDNSTAEGRDLIRLLNTGHIPCTRCGCPAITLQARVGEPINPACCLHARRVARVRYCPQTDWGQ